jgi:glucose/arabinose dehydrogenase
MKKTNRRKRLFTAMTWSRSVTARANTRALRLEQLEDRRLLAVLYRVNAGGPEIADSVAWAADTLATPSPYLTAGNTGVSSTSANIDLSHPSIPAGTPMELFQSNRFDKPNPPNMAWDFSVTPGEYEVRLYFAETFSGAFSPGVRLFDVAIEGTTVLDNYDIFADAGSLVGVMKSFTVTSDGNIDIDFSRVTQNPQVNGIEILHGDQPPLVPSATTLDFGSVLIGQTALQELTLVNTQSVGSPGITIDPSAASLAPSGSPFSFSFSQSTPITLDAGESTVVTVTYTPTSVASDVATLTIPHSAAGSPLSITLSGAGVAQIPISFGKSELGNAASLSRPTSMQFGPDERLYVSQQNGLIHAYTVVQNGPNDYQVVADEVISLIQQIPNHNDDGLLNPTVTERLVTGILVVGTPTNPVIYANSSDPRIGGGNSGNDTNLDTNSSIISRLTWNGSAWVQLDLVRGLPRSDEQHALNGMQLDPFTNTLYVTVGGNTNMGAPSNNFAYLPEYAYSAAILSVDLDAIGDTTYDIPTLDDEDRPGVSDANDPFGGNNGKNQAMIVPGGPVQIYAPGFRNPYDLVITSSGRMYTVDNGPNAGWGNVPVNEGPAGNATNDPNEPGLTYGDGLHLVTGPGYYGGHPNPTRSNPANTFNLSSPQSPVSVANPIESDYLIPGVENGAFVVYPASTNGLTEYTAGNFGGQLQGDLLIASFDNTIKRVKFNETGDELILSENLFTNVGFRPLDVVSPATGPFAGSIWTVDVALGTVIIFEPSEGGVGSPDDLDGDGYTNDDESANGTDPQNPGDFPPDYDTDFISNLLDPDDDNDTLFDEVDLFAVDPANGSNTPVGTSYSWENEGENLGGILGMGFTGLMSNGLDNYEALFDPEAVTAGGAAGVFTIDTASPGTARGATNTQEQAFQFGFSVAGETVPFTAQTRVLGPFNGLSPQTGQEMGLFVGTGDQDNYVQIVLSGSNGGAIELWQEIDGTTTQVASQSLVLPGPASVDLWLTVDPVAGTLQASYSLDGVTFLTLGGSVAIPVSWLSGSMAAGLISTNPQGTPMPVTWDFLNVVPNEQAGDAAAKIEIYPTGSINNSSTARVDSFRIYNNSTGGKQIESVSIDLSTAYMPDMLFDPNGTAGDVAGVDFIPNSGGTATGQSVHSFSVERDGGFETLTVEFTDFDPGELFTFRVDVDPTSVKGAAQPGPSNAADVSGLELSGATVTIHFSDGTVLSGQTFALDEGVSFYKVHSEALLTETPTSSPPAISLVGIPSTPTIVQSASQTVRITAPVGSAVRLLQTEVALHLANVPGGGFDVDPYEANKVVIVKDDVAVVGASGFVDVPITLSDTLVEGGINYLVAVVDYPDGRTSDLSNVIKVALNDLPPGSSTDEEGPATSGVTATPAIASAGPIGISATVTDAQSVVVSAEYFIDVVGTQGTGTPMTATDSTFDETSESVNGTIDVAMFGGLSVGVHTLFIRGQDSAGNWGAAASSTFEKESAGPTEEILYRINAGGTQQATDPIWLGDSTASPSPYSNASAPGSNSIANVSSATIDMTDASIPAGTPMAVFQTNRADPGGGTELYWDFPVTPGEYVVRLYFAETWSGAFVTGSRMFDVAIEGAIVLDNYDIYADAGALSGVVKTINVTSDDTLDIDFLHVIKSPNVAGIEIAGLMPAGAITASAPPVLAGDYDGGGTVDEADFLVWRESFGSTGANLPADGNGDGTVDAADYTVWQDNLGNSLPTATSAAGSLAALAVAVNTDSGGAALRAVSAAAAISPDATGAVHAQVDDQMIAGAASMSHATIETLSADGVRPRRPLTPTTMPPDIADARSKAFELLLVEKCLPTRRSEIIDSVLVDTTRREQPPLGWLAANVFDECQDFTQHLILRHSVDRLPLLGREVAVSRLI